MHAHNTTSGSVVDSW